MFYLRLIVFLFVAGSFNVLFLLIAYTLPVLSGFRQQALAVGVGLLLIADVILLYIVCFRWESVNKVKRYKQFEEILEEETRGENVDEQSFKRAYEKWEDSR